MTKPTARQGKGSEVVVLKTMAEQLSELMATATFTEKFLTKAVQQSEFREQLIAKTARKLVE